MFSWIPIYTELAQKILSYRNRQGEIVGVLKEMDAAGHPVGAIYDQDERQRKVLLTEIDPFTFFTSFNRSMKDENRREILKVIKTKFDLKEDVAEDFDGIPVANALRAWFFPFKKDRKPSDIPSLWALADAVIQKPPEELDGALFDRCLEILNVGVPKLTMGMFWLNPGQYIAWDGNNRKLFQNSAVGIEVAQFSDYIQLIRAVKEKLGDDYPRISFAAWKAGHGKRSGFEISEDQLRKLWKRFHERVPGFVEFTSPGEVFEKGELKFKREALRRFHEEVGTGKLREMVNAGQGDKARDEISKRIQTNLVQFHSWRSSIGSTAAQCSAVLKSYLDAAETPYEGPQTIAPLVQATESQGLRTSWDTLAAVLWALRPNDYFPVKIKHYRELADEISQPLPLGSPTAESFDALMRFGLAFRKALAPQHPSDWIDVQSFMWVVCPNSYGGEEVADTQYWAGGFQWGEQSKLAEFIEGNFWQIGWAKTDTNSAAQKTWANFAKLKVGDEFAIKGYGGRNNLQIHYIGKVLARNGDGRIELQKLDRPLFRDVAPAGQSGGWFGTLIPITKTEIIEQVFHGKPNTTIGPDPEETNWLHDAGPLNLILYGPPGTGKTYQTIERSVKIAEPSISGDHAALKHRFDSLMKQGQIVFLTFHQSYSYEDFVEGIRPVLDEEEESGLPRYECRPGAFKRLAIEALFDCLENGQSVGGLAPFETLWRALLSEIESDPEARYPGLSEKTSYQFAQTERGNLEGTNVLSNKNFFCSRKLIEQVFEAKRGQDSVNVADVMEVVARGCHSQLVAAVFNELRRIERSQTDLGEKEERPGIRTFREKADVVQRFLVEDENSGYRFKPESNWNKYVLVIDEINRGNISKILGELITLLETDKRFRLGSDQNSLVVTLPYSGERFAVPANLYVLGTMNTADKSIALVDLALRRRFEFEELSVNLDVCKGLDDRMRNALNELNRRIMLRKDRDHQIGHAYFVNVDDEKSFNARFRRQIVPLLQEYFYSDWDGLRYVLGESSNNGGSGAFIRKMDIEAADAKESRSKWQWFFDASAEEIDCLSVLSNNYVKQLSPSDEHV